MIKKSKFAAIALSVVMAVSVMPSAVLAAETEVTDENAAYRVDEDSITFTYADGVCTVKYREVRVNNEADYEWKERTADLNYVVAPTCEEPGYDVYTIEIDGKVYNSSNKLNVKKALGHDWKETDRYVDVPAECEEDGEYHAHFVCSRCGAEDTKDHLVLNPTGHDWGATVIECSEQTNTRLVNGAPELIDPGKDGIYETVQYCNACGTERNRTPHELLATEIAYGKVVKTQGIASGVAVGDDFVGPINEADIELVNCKKAGSYTVQFFTKEDKPVNEKTYTVAPHHFQIVKAVEFASEDDKNQCNVIERADGTFKVVNHSCYLNITYYVVEHCSAKGCPNAHCDADKYTCENTELTEVSRTSAVAEPEGHHNINTEAKKAIEEAVAEGITFEELKELVAEKYDHVAVKNDTSTCTEDGTATVEYSCKICKQVVETELVKVVAKGHDPLPPKAENLVPPTCTSEGYYDANVYCNRCGELLRTRAMTIPMAKHTNEIERGEDDTVTDDTANVEFVGEVVVDDKSALYDKFAAGEVITDEDYDAVVETITNAYGKEYTVDADAYTLCDTCGGHKVVLDKDAEIEVLEVIRPSKVDSAFKAGSITLKATYTKDDGTKVTETQSFPYYSTIDEYRGRTDYQPVDPTPVEPEQPEALAAVTGLKAETIGMNRVKLTWDAVEGANGYLIIGLNPTRTGSQIAYTARTNWTDTAADADEFNYYWVIAYNTESKAKGELGSYVWALGRVVGKVTRVAAVATENGIELDWADVTGANSYVILSKTGSNSADFNAPVKVEDSDFIDAGVAAGTVKFYWVYGTYTNEDGKTLAAGKTSPFAWAQAE